PMAALLERHPALDPAAIDDVAYGCANQAGEDNRNVARMAALLAGLPVSVPGETVNRLCASGMSSAVHAYRAIKVGEGDLFITGGMEHMTRGPIILGKGEAPYSGTTEMHDTTFGWRFVNPDMERQYGSEAMGETAENIVEEYGVSREDQDEFAAWSQQKAARATENGRLAREIMPVEIPRRKSEPLLFNQDEYIRPDTTPEVLATLKPAFRKQGTVTAGNASGINDGSCAMLVAGEQAINEFDLDPMARIVGSAVLGVEPRIMGMGPVGATRKVMERTGLTLAEMDVIELNEAFAAQNLAVLRELEIDDQDDRVNPNGGAIALGHPLGMSGARLLQTAAIELHEQEKQFALCTLCVGVGQGMAVILEQA
ncbi:MAG: acetyl-CoA C-acyltransferase, partial [Balneolaceae bacterium]|nr:acetyl-CoA C-acyltransferase [Balneolaceae bacterium]